MVPQGRQSEVVADFASAMALHAPREGANPGAWPGLTVYRYSDTVAWLAGPLPDYSLVLVAQGCVELTTDGARHRYKRFEFCVLEARAQAAALIIDAADARPFYAFTLELDPALVHQVSRDLAHLGAATQDGASSAAAQRQCGVDLIEVILHANEVIRTETDCTMLRPLFLREIIYRLLRVGNQTDLLALTPMPHAFDSRVAAAIEHARAHLAEPLTVSDLARRASMSPSAFAHLFKEATGRPPYQFLKELRLERACELLSAGDIPVRRVANKVGYASVSQFIRAFKRRFGTTPRAYRSSQAPASGSEARSYPISGLPIRASAQPSSEWATAQQ